MHPFETGAFQLGGQQSPDEEESWCLAAAGPLPNTTILSLHNADDLVANFREIHPSEFPLEWLEHMCYS
jgi:hypothetical protein